MYTVTAIHPNANANAEVHHRINDEEFCLSIYKGREAFRCTKIFEDGTTRVLVGDIWRHAYVSPERLNLLIVRAPAVRPISTKAVRARSRA